MTTVTISNDKIAEAINAANFQTEFDLRVSQGYTVANGEITSKTYGTGADDPTAPKLTEFPLADEVGGERELTLNFKELDLTGGNAKVASLSVVGNKIQANGEDIQLKGISLAEAGHDFATLPTLFYANRGLDQYSDFNVVRIPCQPTQMEGTYGVSDYITYFLDPLVEWCENQGVYCVVDYHAIENWDTTSIDTRLKAFWDIAAPRYKDLPHVLYEIFNEPITSTSLGNDWVNFKPTVQGWVDYVRNLAPDNVILVPTPNYDQKVSEVPASPLTGANLVYVEHCYPGHVPGGSYRDSNGDPVSSETLATKTTWMDGAFVNAASTIPVFMSEWGYNSTDSGFYLLNSPNDASYGEPITDYMNSNSIHWTSWSFSTNTSPIMLVNEQFTLTDFGTLVKNKLL